MKLIKRSKLRSLFLILCGSTLLIPHCLKGNIDENRIIKNIIITGSKRFPKETIQSKLPYHVGEEFWPDKSNQAIDNIYKLGHFEQVLIKTSKVKNNGINLHIELVEKPALKEVILEGNKHLTKKEICKKIDFEKIPAAQEAELKKLARVIKKIYSDKGYQFADVKVHLKKENNEFTATFKIEEGPRSLIKKVRFIGNEHFRDKQLRTLLFSREDWILGPLDQSGKYHPQAVESDKFTLENFYQNNGYLHAKVTDAQIAFSKNKRDITATFTIHEGDIYTISSVEAPGNDIFTEQQLLASVPLKKNMPYSKELLRFSIERLRTIWGDQGYIYADVEPAIQPNDTDKTVAITFHSSLGTKVHLNRINIFGNEKSRDKVIRRLFLLDEGDLVTSTRLDASKERVKGLGFFDPKDGVNWKINRIDDDHADIDLMLKEVKTGRIEFKANYGGSPTSMSSSNSGFNIESQISDRNIFGKGIAGHFSGRIGIPDWSKSFDIGISQPWLMDKPIRIGANGSFSQSSYDEIKKTLKTVEEEHGSFNANIGFMSPLWNAAFIFQAGIDHINIYSMSADGHEKVIPEASLPGFPDAQAELQVTYNNRFQSGTFTYLQADISQDTRNHNVHITRGHKILTTARMGLPSFGSNFGFYKFEFDGHYYTPLINETDLVLHLHGHCGYIKEMGNRVLPYRELYHIGGQASVRGWVFGQIGPMWYLPQQVEDEGWQGTMIGAKKAAFFNLELVFPLTQDMGMKGVVFYDGGAGWDTPNPDNSISPGHIKNNSFDYRHSIGVGLRLLNPQPMRIDWAFKLDKRTGEKATEVSFSSYYDF